MVRVPPWLFRPFPPETGWTAYVWLLCTIPFLLRPLAGGAGPWETVASALTFGIFLWSYFQLRWASPRWRPVHLLLQALPAALLPWNPGAPAFLLFAAASAGLLEPEGQARRAIGLVTVSGVAWAWLVDAGPVAIVQVAVLAPLIGALNLHQARGQRALAALRAATARNAALAATAERERIARDLHDALGHTLSLVVLKAQVAQRLAAASGRGDGGRAEPGHLATTSDDGSALARELRELEQAARGALAEVRRAVRGYRVTLDEAVTSTRTLLEAAGVACDVRIALDEPSAARDAVLAAVLREASTNVVRHAGATRCEIVAWDEGEHATLEVRDDGRGGATLAGNGLAGLAERVAAVGGELRLASPAGRRARRRGTVLRATVPRPALGEPAGAGR